VMRVSFITVADELNLTKENAPTNPAFITTETLKKSVESGLKIFGLFLNNEIVGSVGIEKSKREDGVYFIERLAVLPAQRHKKFGKKLMDYAFEIVKNQGGLKISIGIINENTKLKYWYTAYGFIEKEVKTFVHLPFKVCFMEKVVF
jgi:diamine N-acetyltransferase